MTSQSNDGAPRGEAAAVSVTVLGALAILVAYLAAWFPRGAGVSTGAMILGCAASVAGIAALGALRSRVPSRLVAALASFLFVDIAAGFGVPALLPPDTGHAPLVLGLPLRVAIEVYGVALLPVVILPVAYAVTFRRRAP